MDTYAECLVAKKETAGDRIKRMLLWFGCILFCLLVLYFSVTMMPMLIFVAIGAGYGTYLLFRRMQIEYEYLVTNGEMDVDKIIGQEKRKRLLTVKISSFEAFGLLSNAKEANAATFVLAGDGEEETEYYADFTHESLGKVRLVFSPDEAVLQTIQDYLPTRLRR